jgi:hypothetical protein
MLQDDPLWCKDALIYELHVRAFHDSDGDGIPSRRTCARRHGGPPRRGALFWRLPPRHGRRRLLRRPLCLPFNPSRYSEDRLRPFVNVVGSSLRGTPPCGATDARRRKTEATAVTGRPATSAWQVHPQAGRILRRLACVAMMEPADHGRLDDPALVEVLHESRLRGVLVEGGRGAFGHCGSR